MCSLMFGSFTHHQVVILKGHLAIVTLTNREKSSGSRTPMSPIYRSNNSYLVTIIASQICTIYSIMSMGLS